MLYSNKQTAFITLLLTYYPNAQTFTMLSLRVKLKTSRFHYTLAYLLSKCTSFYHAFIESKTQDLPLIKPNYLTNKLLYYAPTYLIY